VTRRARQDGAPAPAGAGASPPPAADTPVAETLFLDAHLHFYPFFDRDLLFDALAANAARLAPGAVPAAALARRGGQPPFRELLAAGAGGGRWRVVRAPDPSCLVMGRDDGREVHVFAARQVAAAERIEALGLPGDAEVPDGLPLAETLARLRAAGLIPVLAWGQGKWLFGRAGVVRAVLADASPRELMIGDSALRPSFLGTPRPMATARQRGLRVLCGSDPLPRAGEERCAGMYATLVAGGLDPRAPSRSLGRLLLDPAAAPRPLGRRHGPAAVLRRLGRAPLRETPPLKPSGGR
jgi:hypothetical protein